MADWISPTGSRIVGTLENIPGIAGITSITDEGRFEYTGRTDVLWDGQETVTRNGKTVFVDGDGEEWTFDQLVKGQEGDGNA